MSITRVWERLLVGGLDDAEALASLNLFGVTTVIGVCREKALTKADGINYLHYPLPQASQIPVGRFDEIIDAVWENVRWGRVLVHSRTGSNRAPVLVAAWMDVVGCKNIDAALADIGRLRPIEPNPVLLRSVKALL